MIRNGYGRRPDSLLIRRLVTEVTASIGIDCDSEFDEVYIARDLLGYLVRRDTKRRRSVVTFHDQRVITLSSPAVPNRNLKHHDGNLPTADPDTYSRP